ncbi:MAG: isoaspartyl peptidase/L-asparaginase [Gemmatimonadetes bacterium]|nr:isoaspartyl peptidase/L-asparaginase [Gemmatimonadota bacterium]
MPHPRRSAALLAGALLLQGSALAVNAHAQQPAAERPSFFLVVHGGAGTIRKADMTPEQEKAYRETMTRAIQAGYAVLQRGGASLDAVTAAINVLEDSPLFNAGKGAVFTNAGTNELDASIMDGATLKAGAVAGVKHIKNPIDLARAVMDRSPHVMLVGEGAEAFAKQIGMPLVDQKYFFTQRRWDQLQQLKAEEKKAGKPVIGLVGGSEPTGTTQPRGDEALIYDDGARHGTVGAVALDQAGNLAAGTSTGGMSNKRWGRVGDSPIIGAGTYADNASCAVSATGDGEYFIRTTAARDICARIQYLGKDPETAGREVLDRIGKLGGEGGVIILTRDGRFATPFNSEGMYRGWVGPDGKVTVQIYKE